MEVDYDAVFASVKFYQNGAASACHKAIQRTTRRFASGYPGWQIYYRIISGDTLFDRSIEAYFVSLARRLARATQRTGRSYTYQATRRNEWLRMAARDAMDYVLMGRYAEGVNERGKKLNIGGMTYQRIRDPLALAMRFGMDKWVSELHYQFSQICFDAKLYGSETHDTNTSVAQIMPQHAEQPLHEITNAPNGAGKPEPLGIHS